MTDLSDPFDFVVVGGGSAGCVLAARLSEPPDKRVCLIEAGGAAKKLAVRIPAAVAMAQRVPELNWRFQTVPQPHMNDRRIAVPRGRGLGGSGLINGMVYFRGHPRDFDDWAAAGAQGWSYREVLPYFLRSEDNEDSPHSPLHGCGGPMRVRRINRPNPLNRAFFQALAGMGLPIRADPTGPDPEGAALRQVCIRGGFRETSATAFLNPACKRPNLTVLTEAHATRIVLNGRRAEAVEVWTRQGRVTVRASGEIVLCAGAIQSPQLLLLSGIGAGEHLSSVGIEVRHHLPGVGRNLHDHVASPVHMSMETPVSYGLSWRAMPRNLLSIAEYVLRRSGPLANNIFEAAAFLKTHPQLDRPNLQLVFQPARRPRPSFPFPIGHGVAISPVGLYPRSRGRLTLASADPFAPPLIDPNLLSDERDLEPLIHGVRLIREIFASAPFEPYRLRETAPGESVRTDNEIATYIRSEGYTVHHPVSTCRMGTDPLAVVDPQLRVIGLEGLRVADASVFPSIVGGNTNAVVVMVAEKAADMILGRPPLRPLPIAEPAAKRPPAVTGFGSDGRFPWRNS